MNVTDENYIQELFIDEATPALSRHSGGGGASDPAAEAVMGLLRRSKLTKIENNEVLFHAPAFWLSEDMWQGAFVIIPEQVTEIAEHAITIADAEVVLCLPTVPPKAGWFGWWSPDGSNNPPQAIYVPDGSVDAYKAAKNWSEFADIMKPISELVKFVIVHVGDLTYQIPEGMTWREWINSTYYYQPNPELSFGHINLIGDNYVGSDFFYMVYADTYEPVLADDVIDPNVYYKSE